MRLSVSVEERNGARVPHELCFASCVAIGYAGRDQATVRHHIDELAALGVPGPASIPSMYWVSPALVRHTEEISVVGDETSAEVEVFVAPDATGELFVTVVSDHSDRKLECVSVAKAKQICEKVIGGVFWRVRDVIDHWDALRLQCRVLEPEALVYQKATMAALLPLEDLRGRAVAAAPVDGPVAFCSGTFPLLDGVTRYAPAWEIQLEDPVLGRSITHVYRVTAFADIN